MSSSKAREALEQVQAVIDVEVDARKQPIGPEEAWNRLRKAAQVVVSKGQKVQKYDIGPTNKNAIMSAIMGRSGTLRAPALLAGDTYYIGYNVILYAGFSGQP